MYLELGAPWKNGFAESFYSRLQDEFLTVEKFDGLASNPISIQLISSLLTSRSGLATIVCTRATCDMI